MILPDSCSVSRSDATLVDGHEFPRVGLGVAAIPDDQTQRIVEQALSVGYRSIDTATDYGNEAGVGRAIAASGVARADITVTTKLANTDHGRVPTGSGLERSLERLHLDYVDLYLIHWPVPRQDRYVETWETIVELRDLGLIRSIGVSNFELVHLERIIASTGCVPAVNQIEVHPHFQQRSLRSAQAEMGIATIAYSPFGKAQILTDPIITRLASDRSISPARLCVAWSLQSGNIVVPKTSSTERLLDNLRSVDDPPLDPVCMAQIAQLDGDGRVGRHCNDFP